MSLPSFNQKVFLLQDNEALSVLIKLGIFLEPRAPVTDSNRKLGMGICPNHPTHWLLVFRAAGFEDPSENGYLVVGWSKQF